MGRPGLYAAMMVKNEEGNLSRCLNSISHIVDEIHIIDTGSTDKTIEIAESFGAYIYHSPWRDSFSFHRNESIEAVSWVKLNNRWVERKDDWFLIIDADEEFSDVGEIEAFRDNFGLLPDHIHCLSIPVRDVSQDGHTMNRFNSLRFFKIGYGVHYENIVHNQVVVPGKLAGGIEDLEIRHYGYDLSPEKMKAKFERTSKLLYKRLAENPDDYEAHYYLANAHSQPEHWDDVIYHGEQLLEIASRLLGEKAGVKLGHMSSIYYTLAESYRRKGDAFKALSYIQKGISLFPNNIDLHFAKAHLGAILGCMLITEGAHEYLRLRKRYEEHPTVAGGEFVLSVDEPQLKLINRWTEKFPEGQKLLEQAKRDAKQGDTCQK